MRTNSIAALLSLLPVSGCLGRPDEATESLSSHLDEDYDEGERQECEQAGGEYNVIYHYRYTDSSGTYSWNVSGNTTTGRNYVDERRIGGGFYRQYRLNYWNYCLFLPDIVTLRYGNTVLSGVHDCIAAPDGHIAYEEVHLQDKQRLLVGQSPAVTTECYF